MNRAAQLWKTSLPRHRYLHGARQRHCEIRHFHRKNVITPTASAVTRVRHETLENEIETEGEKGRRSLEMERALNENSIVISGISGRFPNCDSMAEFKYNLLNGVDMVTLNDRWQMPNPSWPNRMGAMKNMDKFDAEFFGVSPKMAEAMDPQQRRLMEVAFEAIFDAGINPTKMRNTRTGVFVGTLGGETSEYWVIKGAVDDLEGYKLLGLANFLQANRLSYALDLKGPSMTINTGCSASLIAMEAAVHAMKEGTCDQAIVAGTTIHMNSFGMQELCSLHALSPDGACKAFDESANGFVRSEAVIACLIQKKQEAMRHYATIRAIRSNCDGFKKEGLTFPSGQVQENLLRETYKQAGIDPGQVTYFEAHGTGTPAGDPQELNAISKVICKAESRTQPLLLGSVKSNMGHTESAAGLGSVAKVLVAIEEGVIPANLHFKTPNSYVKELFDESVKVVTEPTPWKGGLVGISSFGLGGSNIHMILEPGPSVSNNTISNADQTKEVQSTIPILIPFSGRSKELVEESLLEACKLGKNSEATGLLHQVFQTKIPGHGYRGYGLLKLGKEEEQKQPLIQVDKFDLQADSRPLWFVFPGMGSQWNEMGKDLMKVDAFAESIQNSTVTLKNAGIDLLQILEPNNPSMFENLRSAFAAITAVQIALYDTLTSMGMNPDGFFGHSSGEIICAYADGCYSAEETLLVGDARGRAFIESRESPGGMASVGLSWEAAKARCPPGIYAVCHNAKENVSVSGPAEDIQSFVKDLQSEGVFARQVNTCSFAPHTKYVYPAKELLVKYMHEINGDSRPRSTKWVSTSIPESEWETPLALMSSPMYQANNLVSPVLFHEAVQKVPSNAVVIEIAPRGLFQPLLRDSLPKDCTVISPMHHSVEDKLSFFLSSVGKMYNVGVDVNISKLYPPVHFPVSSQAPMLNSLIKWDHEQSWRIPCLVNPQALLGQTTRVDLRGKYSYVQGHKLDNRCVFPATGYLVHAWKSYGDANGCYFEKCPISFENVSFERATFLKEDKPVELKYSFLTGTNSFIIEEEGVAVIKGNITAPENPETKMYNVPLVEIPENPNLKSLNSEDVYKELRLRGYNYTGEFRGIQKIDNEGKWAQVAWRGNWTSFLDSVLQTIVLSVMTRCTAVPIRFKSITLDPIKFLDYVKSQEHELTESSTENGQKQDLLIPVSIYPALGTIKCPGIELRGLTAIVVPRQKQKETLSVEEYTFKPYFDESNVTFKGVSPTSTTDVSIRSNIAELIDLVLENSAKTKLKIVDVFEAAENSVTETITNIVNLKPKLRADIEILSTSAEIEKLDEKIKNLATGVIGKGSTDNLTLESGFVDLVFLDQPSQLTKISQILQENAYIILHTSNSTSNATVISESQVQLENQDSLREIQIPSTLHRVSEKISNVSETEGVTLTLFKKTPIGASIQTEVKSVVCIDNETFDWLPNLQAAMAEAANPESSPNSRIFLYSQNDPYSGIVGMTKCLRKEPGGDKIRCIFDPEGKLNLDFKNPGPDLMKIIEWDLVMNVVKHGKLGSYRHTPMSQDPSAPSKQVQHAYVNTLTTGDLTSLRWIESPLKFFDDTFHGTSQNVGPNKIKTEQTLCTVHYAAMNFRDIMLATGKLPVDLKSAFNPQDCVMGFEFSGVDSSGQRIMGVMPSKAMASSVLIDPDCMTWKVPDKWTLEEAATTPVVYATAYYALFNRAKIQPHQSILIHSGTGGVGQAAINIALDLNCEIFTTVGTEEKLKYIKELFPLLKEENIGHSRDCSFEQMIMERTNGRGVDLVLNSLADDKLQASIRCLAIHGKFLEIGAFDAFQNSNLGMECFLKNIDFQGIFLNHFLSGSQAEKDSLGNHFLKGIESGVVNPLPRTVFTKDKIEDAFRFMAGGKHMGKVLIEVQKEDRIGSKPEVMAVPRSYFSPDKAYLIVGGLGGLGLEVANWLVDRGARHLVLTSRSGVTTGYQELCLRKWRERGVIVETPKVDLSDYKDAENLIQELTLDGIKQIGGIFNSGLVLKDAVIEEQTVENFQAVAAPKILVTKNMDKLTRQYCTNGLDYFVVFSSMACGRGNASQSNYGLANSVMEQICESRREEGLHGLAIQWGVVGEVGAVAEKIFGAKLTGEEVFEGTLAQRISSCLDVLDMTLHQRASTFSSLVIAEGDGKAVKKAGLLATISHICGVKDLTTIDPSTKLVNLGMDSLIGMEIKQLIERDYDTPLTANELRSMTFNDLLMIEAGTYVKGKAGSVGQDQGQDSASVDLLEMLKGGTETLVKLKTLTAEESVEDSDEEASTLFIVHGIEGNTNAFKGLIDQLNCHVFGFQFVAQSDEVQHLSVGCIAREYVKELKMVQPEGPYNISSYSAGTAIGFEMAMQLESEYGDKVDNLIVLDGCCCWKFTDSLREEMILFDAIIGILKNTVDLSEAEEKALVSALNAPGKEDEKIKKLVELMKVKHSNIDSALVNKYFARVSTMGNLVADYEPTSKLRGKVSLIKAKEKAYIMARVEDDTHYLQQYCERPVTVETVEGDHMSFLRPDKVTESANIINAILLHSSQNHSDDEDKQDEKYLDYMQLSSNR